MLPYLSVTSFLGARLPVPPEPAAHEAQGARRRCARPHRYLVSCYSTTPRFVFATAGEAQLVDRLVRLGNCASPAVGKKCKVRGTPRVVGHCGRGARRCREQGRTDFIPAANDPEGRETWEPGTHIPRPPRPTGAA